MLPWCSFFPWGRNFPIIEPPATPTPLVTATIDPTLAAQFSSILPTRLPTFTSGVPPTQVTFAPVSAQGSGHEFPPALVIMGLAFVGILGAMVSGVVGRR